jgi:hypothetical protein
MALAGTFPQATDRLLCRSFFTGTVFKKDKLLAIIIQENRTHFMKILQCFQASANTRIA